MQKLTSHRLYTAETQLPVCKSTEFIIKYPFSSEGLKPLIMSTLFSLDENAVLALYSIILGQVLSNLNDVYSEKGSL